MFSPKSQPYLIWKRQKHVRHTIFGTHTTHFLYKRNIIKTLENLNERPIRTALFFTVNTTIMELRLINIMENMLATNLSGFDIFSENLNDALCPSSS